MRVPQLRLFAMRLLAIFGVLVAADSALGTARAPLPVLACALGALVLGATGTALLWARPLFAAVLGWMWLTAAFAAGVVIAGSIDAPGAPAFFRMSAGDSAALVVAFSAALAATGGLIVTRSAVSRLAVALLALYVIVPTAASIGRGGLDAALTDGPFAQVRGAYAGAEVLLPLAALAGLGLALLYVAKRRGGRSAIALVTGVALLAATNLAAYTAGADQLPTIVAFERPPLAAATPLAAAPPLSNASTSTGAESTAAAPQGAAWQTSDIAARQADEQSVSTDMLGVSQVDDGVVSLESFGSKTVDAAHAAVAAFGAAPAVTPDPQIERLRKLEAAVPASEYSLDALAATLPADAVALYAFVRDHVGTDVYAGSMRGPLGAWMNRAANSADKTRLLAWLLASKHIAARFERGTLSDVERTQLVRAAATTKPPIVVPNDAFAARYFRARADAGLAFAEWATSKLQAGAVTLGTAAIDASHVPSRHYWVRAYAGGKQIDLDPTLPSMREGQHLGTPDAAFKEAATFPDDDTLHVRVRLIARHGAADTIVAQAQGAIADLAYSPVRVGITPQDGNPSELQTAIILGSSPLWGRPISTIPQNLPDTMVLQIDRAMGDGTTVTVRRTIFDRAAGAADSARAMIGLHTFVLAPGAAPMFLTYEQFRTAHVMLANAAAKAAHQPEPFAGIYPALLSEYFMRDDILAAALGKRENIRLFRDRANLAILHTTETSADRYSTSFDIADNGMNAVASPVALASANLARGWGDTWIEKDLISGGPGAMALWLEQKRSDLYSVGRGGRDDLDSSDVALIDEHGGRQWWDIEPATGDVVGRTPGGWGDMPGYATIMLRVVQVGILGFEAYQAHAACKAGHDCQEKLCEFALSGTLFALSIGEEVFTAAMLVEEIGIGKGVGITCSVWRDDEHEGGPEGGSEEGGGGPEGGSISEHCDGMCPPDDPTTEDGSGP